LISSGTGETAANLIGTTAPTVTFSTGTTLFTVNALGTITFLEEFQGLMAFTIGGTALVVAANGVQSTAGDTASWAPVGGAATSAAAKVVAYGLINAVAGETFTPSITSATTVTSLRICIGNYQRSLGG